MAMILKACIRCGGDLVPDAWDAMDRTVSCLQCGATFRLRPVAHRREAMTASMRATAAPAALAAAS